jgi:putative acetyltransferase
MAQRRPGHAAYPLVVLIRREAAADHDTIRALHRAAFTHGATDDGRPASDGLLEATLVDELRADGDLVPELTLVAVDAQGEVVGHVAMSAATLDGRTGEVVALGPIGVKPDLQRDGIGSALMHATVAAADAMGLRGIVLLGHADYYPRFGFESAVDHHVTPPQDWGRDNFLLRRLDAWVGCPGGAFRYAPAFDRLS